MVQIWIIFFHHSSYVLELLKKLVLDYLAFEWLCQKIQSNSPIKIPNKMWFSVPSFSLPCFQIRGDQVTSKNPQSPGAKLSRKRKDLIKRLDSVINNGTSNITINYFRYVCCFFFQSKCEIVAWVQHALWEYSMSDTVKVVFRRYANKIADKLNKKLLERSGVNGNKFACVVPCSWRGTYRKTSNNCPHSNKY